MSICKLCKKEQPDEVISPENLCIDCLSSLVSKIQQGGKPQKAAIELIESFSLPPLMKDSPLLSFWSLDSLCEPGQRGRLERALSKACTPQSIDRELGCGKFVGSTGELYLTTLQECTCTDFNMRHLPCKHMLRLAEELKGK